MYPAVLALTPNSLAADVRTQLFDLLPHATICNCSNLIRLIRMVKSEAEIGRMRGALEIAEVAAKTAFTGAVVGQPLDLITQAFHESVTRQGGRFEHMAYGPRGIGMIERSCEALRADDCFYADFGTVLDDYLSDTGFTFAARPLSGAMLEKYYALRDAVVETAAQMRPGVKASAVAKIFKDYCRKHRMTEIFPHGHGIGLELRDYPILVPDTGLSITDDCIDVPADLPLETGMVLNLEAPLFMPPEASLHVEQSFLITENDAVPLVEQDRIKPVVPA